MVVRIRLARHGARNDPVFHLVAIQARRRRNALPLEHLGTYLPRPTLQIQRPSLTQLVTAVEGAEDEKNQRLIRQGLAEGGVRHNRKEVRWNVDRIRYWLGVGAQPSESAMKLMRLGGIVNDWPDLDLLRSKTSLPGTAPGLPKIKIASTTRTPEAARAKLRRRGLLPAETKWLPDGGLELPASVTRDGKALQLTASEVTEALSRGRKVLAATPTVFLNRRHPDPALASRPKPATAPVSESDDDLDALSAVDEASPEQSTGPTGPVKKWKKDPSRWRATRRARAMAFALTGRFKALSVDAGQPEEGQGKAKEAVSE